MTTRLRTLSWWRLARMRTVSYAARAWWPLYIMQMRARSMRRNPRLFGAIVARTPYRITATKLRKKNAREIENRNTP